MNGKTVAIVSDYETAGGAAQATRRIEQSLRFALPDTRIERIAFFGDAKHRHILHPIESRLTHHAMRIPRRLLPGWFPRPASRPFAEDRLRRTLGKLRPDVIQLNNVHGAFDWGWGPWVVETCLEFAPVVWTLHDMWSFTGRCAYSYDCQAFVSGCHAGCPTSGEHPRLTPDRIADAWSERREMVARHRQCLTIVTPSHWLAMQARRGMFAQHRIDVIPYGIPMGQGGFRPMSRATARTALGLPKSGRVLLLAAVDLTERRKGADVLVDLWRHVSHRPLTLLTMGTGDVPRPGQGIHVQPLGYVDDDHRKILAYAAADALLHPAPVDNLPNTVLEAMACGTPTIALPVGGLPDLVRPGVTGWLAEAPTSSSLGEATDAALQAVAFGEPLRESCTAIAAAEYSLQLQGDRYAEVCFPLAERARDGDVSIASRG